jgi:hypothetical protein
MTAPFPLGRCAKTPQNNRTSWVQPPDSNTGGLTVSSRQALGHAVHLLQALSQSHYSRAPPRATVGMNGCLYIKGCTNPDRHFVQCAPRLILTGPQHEVWSTSPFRSPEFWGGSQVFKNFKHPDYVTGRGYLPWPSDVHPSTAHITAITLPTGRITGASSPLPTYI